MIVNRNAEYLYDTVAGSMDGLLDGSLVDLFRDIHRLRNKYTYYFGRYVAPRRNNRKIRNISGSTRSNVLYYF